MRESARCPPSIGVPNTDSQQARRPLTLRRDSTKEESDEFLKQSSGQELTDEEASILASRLSWRDEATREQWYREQGIESPNDRVATLPFQRVKAQTKPRRVRNDYPTEEQIKETWDAYKSGKPGAMAEILRKRREEREARATGQN